jgi:hypothetical protein
MERRGRLALGCFLPVDARDDYLRAIADRLAGFKVLQAVTAVMSWAGIALTGRKTSERREAIRRGLGPHLCRCTVTSKIGRQSCHRPHRPLKCVACPRRVLQHCGDHLLKPSKINAVEKQNSRAASSGVDSSVGRETPLTRLHATYRLFQTMMSAPASGSWRIGAAAAFGWSPATSTTFRIAFRSSRKGQLLKRRLRTLADIPSRQRSASTRTSGWEMKKAA